MKFPIYTSLIFKEQIQIPGLRDEALSQPYYSMQQIELYDILCYEIKSSFLSHQKKETILAS
jgi:hypothetical protein